MQINLIVTERKVIGYKIADDKTDSTVGNVVKKESGKRNSPGKNARKFYLIPTGNQRA